MLGHEILARELVLEQPRFIVEQVQLSRRALNVKVFGNPNVFLGHPLGVGIAVAATAEIATGVCIGIQIAEFILAHHGRDKATLLVRTIQRRAVGIKVDREWILNRLDVDLLIKRVRRRVIGDDAPVAPAHAHGVLKRLVVRAIGIRIDLNVPADALNNLGSLFVCVAVARMHLDAGTLLALLVGDLTAISVQFIDRQARPGFQVTTVLYLNRPLIAAHKAQIVQRIRAIVRIGFVGQPEKVHCIGNAGIVSFALVICHFSSSS